MFDRGGANMQNILVIGEHSYIGNYFELYCSKQKEYQFKIDKVGAVNVAWKQSDFGMYDIVILVAAIVHRKETDEKGVLYKKINRDMAVEIAQKAKDAQVGQFIFMSTMAVFGDKAEKVTKNSKPKPTTLYGNSKLQAEKKLLKMSSENFIVTIVRPPMVYGPNCPGNFAKLEKLAKYIMIFPKVKNQRSMIYIGTLCQYIEKMIQMPKTGIYHVQNKEYVNTSDMFVKIRKSYGKHTFIIPGFQTIIWFICKRISLFHKIFGDCYYDGSLFKELQKYYIVKDEISFSKSIDNSISKGMRCSD